jgi:putative dimethyl sulfoxide reductase chaperone
VAFIDDMTAEDRARTYDLLAVTFASVPTEESIGAVYTLAQALGISYPDGISLSAIEREFTNLLVVPNPRYVAPYESAYRDRPTPSGQDANRGTIRGLLMGDSTLAVRQAFVDAGVLPVRDLPDHLANELRLVGHLWHVEACGSSEQAAEAARQRVLFVNEHLLRWIEDVGVRIAQSSETGFYRAAVKAARALLDAESPSVHARGEPLRQEECRQSS